MIRLLPAAPSRRSIRRGLTVLAACAGAACAGAASAAAATAMPAVSGDLSRLVLGATPMVQAVMALLVAASILSWATLFVKLRELSQARGTLRQAGERLKLAATRAEIADVARHDPAVLRMLDEAQDEWTRSEALLRAGQRDGLQERIGARLQSTEAEFGDRMGHGLGILATVSAVAPFVGLFGTVWGIMHSFLGIAEANTTSLAVVAPGIAEALLATGLGLGAAIPATLMYNALGRRVGVYRAELAACATTLMCLVSRDVDRVGAAAAPSPVVPPAAVKASLGSLVDTY